MTMWLVFLSLAFSTPLKLKQGQGASLIQLNPTVGYSNQSFYGTGSVPSLKGPVYGIELEYFFGGKAAGFSLFGSYNIAKQENPSNDEIRSETLDAKMSEFGVKYYSGSLFYSISYAKYKADYEFTQNQVVTPHVLESNLVAAGAAYNILTTTSFDVYLGVKAYYGKLDSELNPDLSSRLDFLRVDSFLQIQIYLPSYKMLGTKN